MKRYFCYSTKWFNGSPKYVEPICKEMESWEGLSIESKEKLNQLVTYLKERVAALPGCVRLGSHISVNENNGRVQIYFRKKRDDEGVYANAIFMKVKGCIVMGDVPEVRF